MSDVFIKSGEQSRYFAFGTTATTSTTTVALSIPIYKESPYSTFQAFVVGTGAVTATVQILASNDPLSFNGTTVPPNTVLLGTITLSGTTAASDGFATIAPWRYVWANVTAVTGTNATVTIIMGV